MELGFGREKMEPRLNIVILGVEDLERAVSFFKDGLGWPLSSISGGDYAIFKIDRALSQAVSAGGTLLKRASETDWGGYSGYFADPDGHPWEVAYNPLFELRQGKLVLPD